MFSFHGWYLEKSLGLLGAFKFHGQSGQSPNGKNEYLSNENAGFSHEQGHPRATLVGGFLLIPLCINVGHNQSAWRIVTLTFLTKSVNNESAFFVQRAHPHQTFFRKNIEATSKSTSTRVRGQCKEQQESTSRRQSIDRR